MRAACLVVLTLWGLAVSQNPYEEVTMPGQVTLSLPWRDTFGQRDSRDFEALRRNVSEAYRPVLSSVPSLGTVMMDITYFLNTSGFTLVIFDLKMPMASAENINGTLELMEKLYSYSPVIAGVPYRPMPPEWATQTSPPPTSVPPETVQAAMTVNLPWPGDANATTLAASVAAALQMTVDRLSRDFPFLIGARVHVMGVRPAAGGTNIYYELQLPQPANQTQVLQAMRQVEQAGLYLGGQNYSVVTSLPDNDPCKSSPCANGGVCSMAVGGGYMCYCPHNFTGVNCRVPSNATRMGICEFFSVNPCLNSGICVGDVMSGLVCRCDPNFHGVLCEEKGPEARTPTLCERQRRLATYVLEMLTGRAAIPPILAGNISLQMLLEQSNLTWLGVPACREDGSYSPVLCEHHVYRPDNRRCRCVDSLGYVTSSQVLYNEQPDCQVAQNKSGECPIVEGGFSICVHECETDADCSGALKCCRNNCGTTCRQPVLPRLVSNVCELFPSDPCYPNGRCVGSLETGDMCLCNPGREGIYCEVNDTESLTRCQKQRRWAVYAMQLLAGNRTEPLLGNVTPQEAMARLSMTRLPLPECREDGSFTTLCQLSVPDLDLVQCQCLDRDGSLVPDMVFPRFRPDCQAIMDAESRPCMDQGMMACYNGGTCMQRGNMTYCLCARDFVGDKCDVRVTYPDSGEEGLCPSLVPLNGSCVQSCLNHTDCPGSQLCCAYGCSRTCAFPHRPGNESCIEGELACYNGGTCLKDYGRAYCSCPPGYTGYKCDVMGTVHFYVRLRFPDLVFREQLSNSTSPEYQRLAATVVQGVQSLYDSVAGNQSVYLLYFSKGSVVAYLMLASTGSSDQELLASVLHTAVLGGRVGGLTVSRDFAFNMSVAADPCFSMPCRHGYGCLANASAALGFVCDCPLSMGLQCQNSEPSLGCQARPCQNGYACTPVGRWDYQCDCPALYGKNCQYIPSACGQVPLCYNGGRCQVDETGLRAWCVCPDGFQSYDCSQAVPNVTHICRVAVDCQNGGSCISSPSGSYCSCSWGYSGRHCEYYVGTGCDSYPCQNGYTCQPLTGGNYSCSCPSYMGRHCERGELHSCNGDCQNWRPCTGSDTGAYCSCGPFFYGRHCEFRKDNFTACSSSPCQHGYACLPGKGGGYECACPEYMGAHCERADSVACLDDCQNGGECLYEDTLSYCWCPRGFYGRHCEIQGEPSGEVNGSLICAHNPCQNGFRCLQQTNGSFFCDCPESWGRYCEIPPNSWCNCASNQKCELFLDCSSGRCREEKKCVDRWVNLACSFQPCEHGYCLNTEGGGYSCKCQPGYSGVNCQVNGICGLLWTGFCGTFGGTCVGDIANGRLCQCPKGRKGPMCELEGEESDCQRQQGLFNLTLDTYYNRRNIRELNSTTLFSLLQMAGLRAVPVLTCSPEGHFLPLRCQRHLPGGNETCHCVDAMGYPVSSNVVAYPGYPPCTAPMSGRDMGSLLCQRASTLCWNGGTCMGNIYAGQLCQCAPGFTGVLCEQRLQAGQNPETRQSMCELSRDIMLLLRSVVRENVSSLYYNNSPVIGVQDSSHSSYLAAVVRSFAMALFSGGQGGEMGMVEHNMSELVLPVFNCTATGHFAPMQCDVSLLNGTRGACYCVSQNGSMIPGTRVLPPALPDCQNVTSPKCPPVLCEMYCTHGFALDLHGCPVCACRKACEGIHCGPGKRCVEGGQCVSVRKPGLCPAYSRGDRESMTNQYHNSMQSCNSTCRDDADCPASHKCCSTGCGAACQPPAEVHTCLEEQRLAMSHVTYLRAMMAASLQPNSSQAASLSLPAFANASFAGLNQSVVVRLPNCTAEGDYWREQCDVDLRTNQSVLCYCVDHGGQPVWGTEQRPPLLPLCHSKPGTCPSMPQQDAMMSNVSCTADYDCVGPLKCCPGLQGLGCLRPALPRNATLDWNVMLEWAGTLQPQLCGDWGRPGAWETGRLCECVQGRAGPLCEDVTSASDTKPTVCQAQQSVFRYLQRALSLPEDSPMLTQGQRMLRALPSKYGYNVSVEPRMRLAMCTDEGDFLPEQCDVDMETLTKVQCYCVSQTGAAANETYTRPPIKPSCGDEPECRVGHPFSNGTHMLRCGPGGQSCPPGYECMMGSYGRHYCCMEPAVADEVCRQAPDSGRPCDRALGGLRYFYNASSRQCQTFRYSGCWGNKNNFLSRLECEGFCVHLEKPGSCPRELPVFVRTSSCPDKCTQDVHCPGTTKCCPTVCGRHCLTAFDAEPEDDTRLCPRGEPLFTREGEVKTCKADSLCGPGYRCLNDVCCLDDTYGTDVCRLPPSPGPCQGHQPAYHYNVTSGRCELFIYGGCRGNDNNFPSIEECCNSCGQGRGSCKRDECPPVPRGSFGTCLQQCTMDAECPGTHVCCDNGCGTTCTAPTRNASSTCFAALEHARRKLVAPSLQCRPVFVPRCRLDGQWEAQQCMDAHGLCWCVDPQGHKVPGTTVRGQARCAAAASTDVKINVEPEVCPQGVQAHCCDMKLCHVTACPANPAAVCRINPCGGCRAEFFDANNYRVNCTEGLNTCQLARQAALEARLKHGMIQLSPGLLPTLAPTPSNVSASNGTVDTSGRAVGLPTHCTLLPATGPCRAAFQHWFYNASAAQCQPFIWGGCGGNPNNFDSPARCYDDCNPQAHPCATVRCGYGERCVVEPHDACPSMRLCPHKVACRAPNPEGAQWLKGVPLPTCQAEGFSYKQCHNQYCWCVDRQGTPFPGTLTTSSAALQCDAQGAVDPSAFNTIQCEYGRKMADARCVHACRDKRCPNRPDAHCVVDLCSQNCSTLFLSPEDVFVQCSENKCDEASTSSSDRCPAPACPDGQKPRLCPDVCANVTCQNNPCTVCQVDHCTCTPYFQDMLSTTTYLNCAMAPITPCRREQCRIRLDQLRESMSPDRRVTTVAPPECSDQGAYLPQQCSAQTGCRCVDGMGRATRVLLNSNDSCVQNETTAVEVTMTFKELDYDDVQGSRENFIETLIANLVAAGIPSKTIQEITLRRGSVIIDVLLASASAEPDPALPLLSDTLQKQVQDGRMQLEWKGQNYTADSQSFSALPIFQAPAPTPTPTPAPTPTPKPSPHPTPASGNQGLSTTSIIIIAVVCGAVGLVLLGGAIYCCCCRRREEATAKDNIYAVPTEVKTQQTPTFAASNMTYGTAPVSCVSGQANNVYATIPEPGSQPPKQEDNVIKVRL